MTGEGLLALAVPRGADAYVCGPDAFMAGVTELLVGVGLDASRIHTEAFGARAPAANAKAPHTPSSPPHAGFEVSFARSGVSVRFDPDRWDSLLELAEECDVPSDWSCRTGVCHRCETAVVAGTVDYDPEPLDVPPDSAALLCCSRPNRDLTLDA